MFSALQDKNVSGTSVTSAALAAAAAGNAMAGGVSRRQPAGTPQQSARPSWQAVIDAVVIRATWSAGSDELGALIDAVLDPAGDRLASMRALTGWIRNTVPDRAALREYVRDESIPANRRTALAGELTATMGRIEELLGNLVRDAFNQESWLVASAISSGAIAQGSGLTLGDADADIVELGLRAQVRTVERRLADLAGEMHDASDASTPDRTRRH